MKNFEGFNGKNSAVIDDILSLDKHFALEVKNQNMKEFIEEHKNEFSIEELEQLQNQLHKVILKQVFRERTFLFL